MTRARRRRIRRRSPSLVHSGLDTVRGVHADARIAVDVACDGVRCPVALDRVRELVRETVHRAGVRDALISVTFLSRRAMTRLNRTHLRRDGATDVIAFGLTPAGPARAIVGDIYVCPDVARENAGRYGAGVREELARLVVHGTLHVLGGTHPEGAARTRSKMWRRQEDLLRSIG